MHKLVCSLFAACLALLTCTATVQAEEPSNINFMIFMKTQPDFEFDPIMFGSFSEFIRAMDGTRLLLLSHNAKTEKNDVINLQQDVLRVEKSGAFEDMGINCQLGVGYDGEDHQISGDCQIIDRFDGVNVSVKAHIPATDLPASAKGTNVWIEVYEESKSGVAIYASLNKK